MIPLRDTIPSSRIPVVTIGIICINIVVFLIELHLPSGDIELFFMRWGVVPWRFTHPRLEPDYITLLSSLFVHGGWMHIIGNMWSLWIFGDNVEDRMGRGGFLCFYLLSGLLAGVLHILAYSTSRAPTVGASGAIAGVMGAYLMLYPRATVVTLVPIVFFFHVIELPAIIFLSLWFVINLSSGLGSIAMQSDAGGVAWWAHIGGFLVGLGWAALLRSRFWASRHQRPYCYDDEEYW